MAEVPRSPEEIVLAHFIVSDDVERSRRFYTEYRRSGGLFRRCHLCRAIQQLDHHQRRRRPTDDKPTVTLETPPDPDRAAAFSISGSKTSRRCTPNGAPGAPIF